MYQNKGNKATRFGFGEGVVALGHKYSNTVVLGADITASVSLNGFVEAFPNRFYSLGIAEQNVVGVATGLALSGKLPILSTYGVFATMRTADQVRISVCYNNVHVIIGGAHAGISVGPDGATHQALEDIALMRSLPNMTVLSPCDANQAKLATIAAAEQVNGPVYIRFGREPEPNFTSETDAFVLGKGQLLRKGSAVTIVATGHMVWEALQAAAILETEGVDARVVNIHTIKPIDREILVAAAHETGAVVTVEEHQVYGGLGGAVAEVLSQEHPVPMDIIGMPDCFGESGTPEELLEKYGLTAAAIAARTLSLYKKKQTITAKHIYSNERSN
ncbi:MAG: transketolase family protein [Bacteroidales bacterium]|nr:transketolase family protein [Bacteroidales bacterium]MBN2748992.1 transketolase family protein [Bacteroidales bacterium]